MSDNEVKGKSRDQNLVKNSFILSIGTLIPKALTIAVLPILTTYLTTSEYGNYDLIISVTSLIVPVATMQIQQAVFRNLLASNMKKEKEVYTASALIFVIMMSLISAPITYIIGLFLGLSKEVSAIMCSLVFAESVYILLGQVVRGVGKNLKYSLGVVVYAVANAILLIICVYILRMGLKGVVISITSAYGFSAVVLMLDVVKEYDLRLRYFRLNAVKELLSFSMPIVPSSISLWIVNLSDRFIIVHFLGTALNGIYSVANKIPALYSTAYSVFNLAWTETAAQVADAEKQPEVYYSRLFSKLYSFLIGVLLCIIAVSPLVYKVFVNEQYYMSYYQTAVLFFGVFFNSLVMYYAGIYIALRKTKQVGFSSAAGAVINIVINLLLVNHYGLYAASISTAISYFVIAVYRAVDINRYIKISYDKKQLAVGFFILILSAISYYMRNWIGYGVCISIAVLYNIINNRYMYNTIKNKICARLKKN